MTIYKPFRVTSKQDDICWYYEPLGRAWRVTCGEFVDYVEDEEVQREYTRVIADFYWYTVSVVD